jgi:hypothetical protein
MSSLSNMTGQIGNFADPIVDLIGPLANFINDWNNLELKNFTLVERVTNSIQKGI